jgi:hypothetical protein
MKSYSKLNTYYKGLIPGLLINSNQSPGPGWVEVGPKVSCPDQNAPEDPDGSNLPPDLALPIPSLLVTTSDPSKLRIISTAADGTIINTDYMINVMSMTKPQLQTYLTQNLGTWGYWSTLDNTPSLVPFINKHVTGLEVFTQLIVLPPIGLEA